MDQRVETNALLFDNLEKKIETAVKELNFTELEKKYGTMAESFGTCALSCMNWLEALKEKDCLCLTLNVTRSQVKYRKKYDEKKDKADKNRTVQFGTCMKINNFIGFYYLLGIELLHYFTLFHLFTTFQTYPHSILSSYFL